MMNYKRAYKLVYFPSALIICDLSLRNYFNFKPQLLGCSLISQILKKDNLNCNNSSDLKSQLLKSGSFSNLKSSVGSILHLKIGIPPPPYVSECIVRVVVSYYYSAVSHIQ